MPIAWPDLSQLKPAYRFELDEATPSNNVIKNLHFQVYRNLRNSWAWKVKAAVGQEIKTVELAWLAITRFSAGSGLDWDNAYGGLKPLLDCLVVGTAKNPSGLGLIRDDSPKCMPFPPLLRQEGAKRGQSRTLVEIFDLTGR